MTDQDEKTSLLTSSTAITRTQPLSAPAPSKPERRPTLSAAAAKSIRNLDEIERRATRLAEEADDTDSIQGLLGEDDWSVGSGMDDFWDEGAQRGSVTRSDLEFLSGNNNNKNQTQSIQEEGTKERMIDALGMQLLDCQNPESEQRILRKTLKLGDAIAEEEEREDAHRPPKGRRTSRVSLRMHESTRALRATTMLNASQRGSRAALLEMMKMGEEAEEYEKKKEEMLIPSRIQMGRMLGWAMIVMMVLYLVLKAGTKAVGPPRLPVGEYKIVEAQVGQQFFQYYEFYSGKDSAGSNGYNLYVSREVAEREGIVKVVTEKVDEGSMVAVYDEGDERMEEDWLLEDLEFLEQLKRKNVDDEREKEVAEEVAKMEEAAKNATKKSNTTSVNATSSVKTTSKGSTTAEKKTTTRRRNLQDTSNPPKLEAFNPDVFNNATGAGPPTETFVYLSSSPTEEGPRNSIRLEGKRRFNRGLFIIDLRHMPAGCGTWPAFWLTDEANWPVNGEIDIVEGVNYQDTAKTALHTTKTCRMDDVPEGSKTGTWDTAVGIPDKKTGIPDMTFRFAQDCFVYDPHQWINQGCVATDMKMEGRSLGVPLNNNGGGVYALEWDPINTHIRTWVFSPHGRVPRNLRDAMRTAMNADESTRVAPDTTKWGLPYGHFPIGDGTNCPSEHFRNMRLVINLAFCGSVSGTRYWMDCPKQMKKHKTCEKWVASNPDELNAAYWKIRGVYVYEREWQKKWN